MLQSVAETVWLDWTDSPWLKRIHAVLAIRDGDGTFISMHLETVRRIRPEKGPILYFPGRMFSIAAPSMDLVF